MKLTEVGLIAVKWFVVAGAVALILALAGVHLGI